MKTLLLSATFALTLSNCATTTETRPDGTVVKTWGVDRDAFAIGAGAATTIIDKTSGK